MRLTEFLDRLIHKGIAFKAIEDSLSVSGDPAVLTRDVLEFVSKNKFEIIAILNRREHAFPLSYNQRSLWYIYKLSPDSASYNVGISFKLPFLFDRSYLHTAVVNVCRKHKIFSVIFFEEEGDPFQSYAPEKNIEVEYVDVGSESDSLVRKKVIAKNEQPFNLEQEVIRFTVFERDQKESILLIDVHHIVFDGWSGQIFLDDFWKFYFSMVLGKNIEIKKPLVAYDTYVKYQEEYLKSDKATIDLDYWCRILKTPLPLLNLPTDRNHPERLSNNGEAYAFEIPRETAFLIKKYEKSNPQTLFTLLISAYFILLYRYSGDEDQIVGTPTAGRNDARFLDVCGYFVNPIALRTKIDGSSSFSEFLAMLHKVILGGLKHQQYPMGMLAEKVNASRIHNRTPIFQAMFILQRPHSWSGHEVSDISRKDLDKISEMCPEYFPIPEEEGQFELMLSAWENGGEIQGVWKYNSNLFDKSTIEEFHKAYVLILHSVFSDTSIKLCHIPLDTWTELEWRSKLPKFIKYPREIENFYVSDNFRCNSNVGTVQYLFELSEPVCILTLKNSLEILSELISLQSHYGKKKISFSYCEVENRNSITAINTHIEFDDLYFPIQVLLYETRQNNWFINVFYCESFAGPQYIYEFMGMLYNIYCHDGAYVKQFQSPMEDMSSDLVVQDRLSKIESDRKFWQKYCGENCIDWSIIANNNFYRRNVRQGDLGRTQFEFELLKFDELYDLAVRFDTDVSTLFLAIFSSYIGLASNISSINIALLHSSISRRPSPRLVVPLKTQVEKNGYVDIVSLTSLLNQVSNHLTYCPHLPLELQKFHGVFEYISRGDGFCSWGERMTCVSAGLPEKSTVPVALSVFEEAERGRFRLLVSFSNAAFYQFMMDSAVTHIKQCVSEYAQLLRDATSPLNMISETVLQDISNTLGFGEVSLPEADKESNSSSVLGLFDSVVQRHSGRVAVIDDGREYSYKYIDLASTQLASLLIESKDEGPVALYLNKSILAVISVLACWKSGRAFVPLDPGYPQQRLSYMLSNAKATLVLVAECAPPEESWFSTYTVFFVDKLLSEGASDNSSPLAPIDANLDAYIIYTSGTTGKPKGVMVKHASLLGVCQAWCDEYHLSHRDVHLQLASFSFDVFIGDLVRALSTGGALVLCDKETMLDPPILYKLITKYKIQVAEFVPAVLKGLLDYLKKNKLTLPTFRLLIVGSDSWVVDDYRSIRSVLNPQARLINSYGTSETTIDSCFFEYTGQTFFNELAGSEPMPIGKPFNGMGLYVMNEQRELCAIGVPGDLFISGVGVSSGYVGLKGMTESRFVTLHDPIRGDVKAYKTGDLAVVLPSYDVQLLGRIDGQVKINGVRVELAEIEFSLVQLVGVEEAVAKVSDDGLLLAYVVLSDEGVFDELAFQERLSQDLPAAFVPSKIIQLNKVPLTHNGKVDRSKLPSIDVSLIQSKPSQYVPPVGMVESQLERLWGEILKQEKVSVLDDFFRIGGHSMLAVKMISMCRDLFGVDIRLATFLKSSKIRDLGKEIVALQGCDIEKQGEYGFLENDDRFYFEKRMMEYDKEKCGIYIVKSRQSYLERSPIYLYLLDAKLHLGLVAHIIMEIQSPVVVVGIDNYHSRKKHFMPDSDGYSFRSADMFYSFLINKIIPCAEGESRSDNTRMLLGHSFGGVFASLALSVNSNNGSPFHGFGLCEPSWGYLKNNRVIDKCCNVQAESTRSFVHVSWASNGGGKALGEMIERAFLSDDENTNLSLNEIEGSHESIVQYAYRDAVHMFLNHTEIAAESIVL